LPLDILGEYTAELISEVGAPLLLHCPTEGHSPLRETLAQWVAARGIRARGSDVLVVSGSQQGLDLVARIFIDPGDVVVVEEPTYIGALQSFRVAGAKIIGIPVDEDGMRTDILASILERERPKLIYTLPTYQNPSGAVMSVDRRRHLLELASRWHVPILEDDPYSELRYEGEPLPSLKALDENDLVLYQSTFSKALFPGLRIGYLVVPPVVLRQLTLAKQGADLHANSFSQYLLERFVRDGHFAAHIENTKRAYRRRRDVMALHLVPDSGRSRAVGPPGRRRDARRRVPARASLFRHRTGRTLHPAQLLPRVGGGHRNRYRTPPRHGTGGLGIERLLDTVREAAAYARPLRKNGPTTSPVV